QPERDDPERQDRDHDQRGHHRAMHEQRRDAAAGHRRRFRRSIGGIPLRRDSRSRIGGGHAAFAPSTVTRDPGARRSWPAVTTVSPGCRPDAMTVSSPTARSILMLRSSTVWSGLTTKTYWPFGPFWIAVDGVTTALSCSYSVSTTFTNWPGHSAVSLFANSALRRIVPVVVSALLSMKLRRPVMG